MPFSNSTWDRKGIKKTVSPAFSLGRSRVTFEFLNRKSTKIFSAQLGRVEFSPEPSQLESNRNSIIKAEYGNRTLSGYKYQSISNTHILPTLLGTDLTVLGHGIPTRAGYENCSLVGAVCVDGIDAKCEVGKCAIGTLTRVSGRRWRYDSLSVPGLYYYVFGDRELKLRTIRRGKFILPAGSGSVSVPYPSSVSCRVLLPPKLYAEETFTRAVIKRYSDEQTLVGLEDSANNFARTLLSARQSTVPVERSVYEKLLEALQQSLDPDWFSFAKQQVDEVWSRRYLDDLTNLGFALECYEVLSDLYNRAVQVSLSGFRPGRVEVDPGLARPLYDRLPEAYRSDEAQWLTAGADNELSFSKSLLDGFYDLYLNPETCYPLNLDWIAQHMGFTSGLWDLNWSNHTKRLLLENAHVNNLAKYGGMWVTDNATLKAIDLSRIECVEVDGTEVSCPFKYVARLYNPETDLTTLAGTNTLTVDVSNWPGLLPARGSMLSLLFMFWALGIKANSPAEMSFDESDSTYRVRTGLRELEFNSPVNLPLQFDVLHVGSELDQEAGNYANQLIADIGVCYDEQIANTVVVRMPFYYNRNGRTWDAAKTVLDGWMPSSASSRVQYAYTVSDLLVADDIFFEPVNCDA